jgi:hypothetical protein
VQWGEALPVNVMEELQADKMALDMGIVDKMTVAQKYTDRWGVDWTELEPILEAENERKEREADAIRNSQAGMGAGGGQRPPDGEGEERR